MNDSPISPDFYALFEDHRLPMFLIRPENGRIFRANNAACDYYLYPREELETMTIFQINVLPEVEVRSLMQAVATGQRSDFFFNHRLSSGEIRQVEVFSTKVIYGKSELLHSIIVDATARAERRVLLDERDAAITQGNRSALRERNLQNLLDSTDDMVLVADLEGKLLYANQAFCRALAISRNDAIGANVLDFHPVAVREEARVIFGQMLTGEREVCPLPISRKDGSLLSAQTRIWKGLWNESDCIFASIKNLSESLPRQVQREEIFKSSPVPMVLSNGQDGAVLEVNSAFVGHTGFSAAEVLGRRTAELGLWEDVVAYGEAQRLLLDSGHLDSVRMRYKRKNGERRIGLFSGRRFSVGTQSFVLTIISDITAVEAAREDLVRERARLSAIIDGTKVGTWEWNVQTGETRFNEEWAEICGYSLAELAPTNVDTWLSLAHPEDLADSKELLDRHFAGQTEHYECEARMRHKDGHWVWVLDRGKVASWTADGRPEWMFGTHQDISGRKSFEAELRHRVAFEELLVATSSALFAASEQELDTLLDEVLRLFGEFIDVDRSYLFKFDGDKVLMNNTHEWCAQGISPEKDNLQGVPVALFPAWMETLRTGGLVHIPDVSALPPEWSAEREILEPQGIQSLLALPVTGPERQLGFIGFDSVRGKRQWGNEERSLLRFLAENVGIVLESNLNAAELRSATERAQQLAHEADVANRTKSLFLANMSHEIRTPMNAVLGFAQLLERDPELNQEQLRNVKTIIKSGEHLLGLINDILDMSKIEAGQAVVNSTAFCLHEMLRELAETFSMRAADKDLGFSVEWDDALPQRVELDTSKVRQILFNLIGNALKFTSSGSVAVKATSSPHETFSTTQKVLLSFSVSDTGPGIEQDELEQLLTPFQQASAGRTQGGTGLGLAISNKFAELMGGRLDIKTRPGVGSVFTFSVTATFDVSSCGESPEIAWLPTDVWLHDRRPKALIVDDIADNRELLRQLLESLGFITSEAVDGAECLKIFSEWKPDVVLMDIRMPNMDGFEATSRLKATDAGRNTPVIAVTASAFEEDERRVFSAGADAYLRKPFRPDELLGNIARHLDLQIDYAASTPGPPPMDGIAPTIAESPPSEEVSAEMGKKLLAALGGGNMERLLVLLDTLAVESPGLAGRLRKLADAYDYDRLEAFLKDAVAPRP